jgi:hypothetical protein
MPPDFIPSIAPVAAAIHAAACAANLGASVWAWRRRARIAAGVWLGVAGGFAVLAAMAFLGEPVGMPAAARAFISAVVGPVVLSVGALVGMVVFYLGRRWLVHPAIAWTGLNAALGFLGLSLVDPAFAAIVGKPDNVPIVGMVFLLGFFLWLGTRQAVENDRRLAAGGRPVESDYADSVFVWPDVVYLELIGIVVGMAVLIVWSLAIRAPLEQPANPVVTPNPSKAPWYFLGLQEMLVYFAPWMAGVVLPLLIILGLMALPYLDVNPKGNGYYTIRQRRWVWLVYHFGFVNLWVVLILIGVFFRGPNWSFFGIYEPHDPHKVTAMTNITLAELCWNELLGRPVPQPALGVGGWGQLAGLVWREIFGLVALAGYYVLLPYVLSRTVFRRFRVEMGAGRFWIMVLLLLTMGLLPIKMLLNWTLHLSYIVNIPEYFFYF